MSEHDEFDVTTDGNVAIIPDHILGADISDRAVRLYAAMQIDRCHGRKSTKAELAARLRISVAALERAASELETIGGDA